MTEEIKKLKELIDGTDNIVFFGGAGVSTDVSYTHLDVYKRQVQSWQLTSLGVYGNVLIYMASSFLHENSGQTNCLSAHRL